MKVIDKLIEKPVETMKQYGSPEKVKPKTEVTDTYKVSEISKKNVNDKKLITQKVDYVPWFVGPIMLGIVILAYIVMAIMDIGTNPIRAIGFLSAAIIGAAVCIYYHYTKNV